MKNIKKIVYPNNAPESTAVVEVGKDGVTKIENFLKNGEMAKVGWLRVLKARTDGYSGYIVVAEIKESICDIYGKDNIDILS